MEGSGVALITFMCILFLDPTRTSGAEVEMQVSPGDDVTLYCDCVWRSGFYIFWFRNCSHKDQPPLIISTSNLIHSAEPSPDLRFSAFPRYAPVWNQSSNTVDLLVRNVSESDLGLYYCARCEKKIRTDAEGLHYGDVYHYGNRTTRLSLLDLYTPPPSPPPVSDCSICWKLLVILCPVCALISSVLSSTCVCCICNYRAKERFKAEQRQTAKRQTHRNTQVQGGEVCYASLDIQNRRQKHLKTRRVENSEFSTYSEVRADQI